MWWCSLAASSGALPPRHPVLTPLCICSTCCGCSFVFLPRALAVSALVGFLLPYYALTHRGNPAHTGERVGPGQQQRALGCRRSGCK